MGVGFVNMKIIISLSLVTLCLSAQAFAEGKKLDAKTLEKIQAMQSLNFVERIEQRNKRRYAYAKKEGTYEALRAELDAIKAEILELDAQKREDVKAFRLALVEEGTQPSQADMAKMRAENGKISKKYKGQLQALLFDLDFLTREETLLEMRKVRLVAKGLSEKDAEAAAKASVFPSDEFNKRNIKGGDIFAYQDAMHNEVAAAHEAFAEHKNAQALAEEMREIREFHNKAKFILIAKIEKSKRQAVLDKLEATEKARFGKAAGTYMLGPRLK